MLLALIMLLALTMSGCGSAPATSGQEASVSASDAEDASAVAADVAAKTPDNSPFTIKTTIQTNELSKEQIAEFEKENPNLKVEIVTADNTKLMAMLAAGNPVDVIRTTGISAVPTLVTRELCLPLDSYLDKSTVIKRDDFTAVQALYQFDGQNQGSGPVYGFAKDWSIDTTLWINKKIFRDAGVEIPSADKALTSSELADLAKKLTKKENGKITVFGYVPTVNTDAIAINLASIGKSLWSADMKTSNFSSPEAKSMLQYYVDLRKEGCIPSSINPLSDGWGGADFMDDKIAIYQTGYWYGGMIRTNDKIKDRMSDFAMLPSPIWDGGKGMPAVTGGTGAVVYSKTKNPDAVWKFMEYYFAGKPADERASSGWGLPSFKSKMSMIPAATDFDKAVNAVNDKEVALADLSLIKMNKFAPETSTDPILTKYLDPVIYDKATLDDAVKQIDTDISSIIADGMDVAGVE
jgi:multiple sugar transport system substrate-binding protein